MGILPTSGYISGVAPKESLSATGGICCLAGTATLGHGPGAAQGALGLVLDVSWPCSSRCH